MAQADFNVANQSFPAFRADMNNQLLALATNSSGASAPSTTYPYMQWADTTGGIMYLRNAANSGWSSLRTLDGNTVYATYFRQRVDSSFLALTGGLTGGANIELYGPTHGNANIAVYDATTHTFRSVDGATRYGQFRSGGLDVGAPGTTACDLQLGTGTTGNRSCFIDLIGDTTYTDYALRIIRNNAGANADSELLHRGTGTFSITAQDAGGIALKTSNASRLSIDSAGHCTANTSISGTITRQTAQSASGASGIQFTSLPSWVKQITLHFSGISLSGTDRILIRLSTGGTFAATGYNSSCNTVIAGAASQGETNTTGALLLTGDAANVLTGSYTFTNITGNTWIGTSLHIYENNTTYVGVGASKITLGGTLDGIRILPSGSNTFDAGTINITYSG